MARDHGSILINVSHYVLSLSLRNDYHQHYQCHEHCFNHHRYQLFRCQVILPDLNRFHHFRSLQSHMISDIDISNICLHPCNLWWKGFIVIITIGTYIMTFRSQIYRVISTYVFLVSVTVAHQGLYLLDCGSFIVRSREVSKLPDWMS